jgi:hypothetical protein
MSRLAIRFTGSCGRWWRLHATGRKTFCRITYAEPEMIRPGIQPLLHIGNGTHANGEPSHALHVLRHRWLDVG